MKGFMIGDTANSGAGNRRYEIEARILSHTQTREDAFELVLEAPQIASSAEPGQFVEILFGEHYAHIARRPFSIYSAEPIDGSITILYRRHGAFTSGLKHKSEGDSLSLIGPLGRSFHYEMTDNLHPILIAGGIGAPPISFLAERMSEKFSAIGRNPAEIVVINAARTASHLIGIPKLTALKVNLHLVTNDGTAGKNGTSIEVLADILESTSDLESVQIFACGPMLMLRSISDAALPLKLGCQLSIETSMPCGIGTCAGCAVAVRDGSSDQGFRYALACTEGPVFEAEVLIW